MRSTLWMVLPLGARGRLKDFGKTIWFITLLSWFMRLFEFGQKSNELYLES